MSNTNSTKKTLSFVMF